MLLGETVCRGMSDMDEEVRAAATSCSFLLYPSLPLPQISRLLKDTTIVRIAALTGLRDALMFAGGSVSPPPSMNQSFLDEIKEYVTADEFLEILRRHRVRIEEPEANQEKVFKEGILLDECLGMITSISEGKRA